MFWLLLILFTVIPAIEIALFVEIGGRIGAAATLLVVLFTGIAGASLARAQGTAVLRGIQEALGRGQMPTDELVEGALVLFGGALLLTPGFLTDLSGLLFLLPPTRRALAALLRRWASARIQRGPAGSYQAGAWRFKTGPVRPGPAAREAKIDLSGKTTPTATEGPRTIDAEFTLVEGEDEPGDGAD